MKDKIKQEIKDFEDNDVKIAPGLTFNQLDTIEKATHYYLSDFESGQYDDDGFRKYFYNITRSPTNNTVKALDWDVSDIRFLTASGGEPIKTWFLERAFKFWFKDNNFGTIINGLLRRLARYGSCVVKTVGGEPHFVDLKNFVVDPRADSLEKANYIIEQHPYSGYRFNKKAKENDWDHREEVLESFHDTVNQEIMVYERYGPDENYNYKRFLIADPGQRRDQEGNTEPADSYVLAEDDFEPEELPYHEFHLEKIDGRWLGIGVPEILFDAQIRMNEIVNHQVKSSHWASKMIFQTIDDSIQRNVLTQVKNGEILTVDNPLEQVNNTEQNLPAYNQEQQLWFKNRNEQTFSHSVMQGERPPAGTPLGSAQLATSMARAYFDVIREDVASSLKEYFYDTVIPYFKENMNDEFVLNLTGEDAVQLRKLQTNVQANEALLNYVEKNKHLPSDEEIKMMKSTSKNEVLNEEQEMIPEGFFDDVDYKLDIIITGEQEDTRVQSQNLQMALQAISSNRALLKDPVTRKIFNRILEKGGISLEEIAPESDEAPSPAEAAQQMAGGGVSRPSTPQTPTPGRTQTTV